VKVAGRREVGENIIKKRNVLAREMLAQRIHNSKWQPLHRKYSIRTVISVRRRNGIRVSGCMAIASFCKADGGRMPRFPCGLPAGFGLSAAATAKRRASVHRDPVGLDHAPIPVPVGGEEDDEGSGVAPGRLWGRGGR
jgi:hypothetical protein